MVRPHLAISAAILMLSIAAQTARAAQPTTYVLPQGVHWIANTPKDATSAFHYAVLRGKYADKCDNIIRIKFPDGFVYPWHTNDNVYSIYTILKGTLVIGFDKNHARSAEWTLPAGSVMQGLGSEPHYGRAVGETIFDIYTPCNAH
jgi:hypothetical protein